MKNSNTSSKQIDNIIYISVLTFAVIIIFTSIIVIITQGLKINPDDSRITKSDTLGTISTSVSISICGNGIQEYTEDCDGPDFSGNSCSTLGYDGGTLTCNANCTFNTSLCITLVPTCGNGVKESGEDCDGSDLGDMTCLSFGYLGGTLTCNTNCTYNKSNCIIAQAEIPLPETGEEEIEEEEDNDADDDGMIDSWENQYSCMNSSIDDSDFDYDNDDLINYEEYSNNTDPCDNDTDSDGMPDGWEVKYELDPIFDDSWEDPDEDGFTNLVEYQNGTNPHVYDKSGLIIDRTTLNLLDLKELSQYTNCLIALIIIFVSIITTVVIIIKVKRSKK